jgi:hypothetical protein
VDPGCPQTVLPEFAKAGFNIDALADSCNPREPSRSTTPETIS